MGKDLSCCQSCPAHWTLLARSSAAAVQPSVQMTPKRSCAFIMFGLACNALSAVVKYSWTHNLPGFARPIPGVSRTRHHRPGLCVLLGRPTAVGLRCPRPGLVALSLGQAVMRNWTLVGYMPLSVTGARFVKDTPNFGICWHRPHAREEWLPPSNRTWLWLCNRTTPGDVRPIHRTDVRIVEPDGQQNWIDVKVRSTKPGKVIKNVGKMAKCKQYGQGPPHRSNGSTLHGRMIPLFAEAHGRLAPMADAMTSHLITHQEKLYLLGWG